MGFEHIPPPFTIKFHVNYFQFSYKMHELQRNNEIYCPGKSKMGCSGSFLPTDFSVRKSIKLTISQSCFVLINLYFPEKNKNIYHWKNPTQLCLLCRSIGILHRTRPWQHISSFSPMFWNQHIFFFYWRDVFWLLLPLLISYAEVGILDLSQIFSHEDEGFIRDPDHGQDRANDSKREKLETLSFKYSEVWRQPLLLGKQKYF